MVVHKIFIKIMDLEFLLLHNANCFTLSTKNKQFVLKNLVTAQYGVHTSILF